MKLPRDLSGHDLAKVLRAYGYSETRQTGSHIRLSSSICGSQHYITIPAHRSLKVGTLSAILTEVANYLKVDLAVLKEEIFGK